MKTTKHVGKLKYTGVKVIVVFRTLPGESDKCLVLPLNTLPDMYHEAINQLAGSEQGQQAWEFGEIMFVRFFPDGRQMLSAMQQDGRLQKVPTDQVIMISTPSTTIPLDQLNVIIAEQKGVAVDELCNLISGGSPNTANNAAKTAVEPAAELPKEPVAVVETAETTEPLLATPPENLSGEELAKFYRSQAHALYKQAAQLRRQADELDPPVATEKRVTKKSGSSAKETEGASE